MGSRSVAIDLGGVLLTDPTLGSFWMDIAGGRKSVANRARELWFGSLREPFERGETPEIDLWEALGAVSGCEPSDARRQFLSNFREIPNGVDALRVCHLAGFRVVLATNHYGPWISIWQERFDWFGLIDSVVCSSDVGARKPDPAFYAATLRACQPVISPIYFVDDIGANVDAATRGGFVGLLGDSTGAWSREVVRDGHV